MRILGLILAFMIFAAPVFSAPVRIVLGPNPSPLEKYAVSELQSYLPRLSSQPISTTLVLGTPASNSSLARFTPSLASPLAEQEIVVRSGKLDGRPAVAIAGGSPAAVLWSAYSFLEHFGIVFEFSGEVLPAKKPSLSFAGINVRRTPSLAERGLRLHLNFPMDQSAYSLPDFLTWVDRIARMKFNYLMFHFYSAHPWFMFRYRDAVTHTGTFFVGSYIFGGQYKLPADMIGRSLIHNKAIFFPPELEGMKEGEDLYRKTEARMRAVMDRAHARGIKIAVSFEPLGPPGDIAAHIDEWAKDTPGGREAVMHDMTVARLLACMDAYPQADEYQIISVEGSNDAPPGMDLKAELHRLCQKHKIPFDPDDAAMTAQREAGVNLAPYNAPAEASALAGGLYQPVVSTLRYVDMALDVLADPRITSRTAAEHKQTNIGIYLPWGPAVKMCTPALRIMIPRGGRLQLMVDYGARGTADQMPTWDAFRGADMGLGILTWLEFDGLMMVPESWPRSVFDCVRNARGLPVTTMAANHWRVSGLEADAACLAEVPWDPSDDYDTWFNGYLTRLFGPTNAPTARRGYDALEAATLYGREHLFNIGFCYEANFINTGGYDQHHVDAAKALYEKARQAFLDLARALPQGRPRLRAEYLANRCLCAQYHLDAIQDLARSHVTPTDPPGKLAAAPGFARKALAESRAYMTEYAKLVLDRGDEGMLVNYQFGMVRTSQMAVDSTAAVAAIASADPASPVMQWSFEKSTRDTVPDDDAHGFAATCVGKLDFAPGRAGGRALRLDGKTYLRVDAGSAFNPGSFTVAAWAMPDKVNARRGLIVKRIGNAAAPFVFGIDNGHLRFEGCGTSATFWPFNFDGPAIDAGQWSHVAVVLDAGKQITLYLNGKLLATQPIAEAPAPNTEPIVLGREAWGGEEGQGQPALFVGLMDDVKIWKRALTPDEIAALAQ